MKQQSVHIMRPFVDGKRCQRHEARASSSNGGLARLQGKGKDWQREKPGEPLGVFLAASLNV
jgi:hypothetical protein